MKKPLDKISKIVLDGSRRNETRIDNYYRELNNRIYYSKKGDLWYYDLLDCNMRLDYIEELYDRIIFIGDYCGHLDFSGNRNVWEVKSRQEIIDQWNKYILEVNSAPNTSWAFALTKGTTRKVYKAIVEYGIENVFDEDGVPYLHIFGA